MDEHAVYDHITFAKIFGADLVQASALVLIHVPFLTIRGVERFAHLFEDCCRRRVQVCVFIEAPLGWENRHDKNLPQIETTKFKQLQLAIDLLRSLGAHVSFRTLIHEKLAVIDDYLLWDGSLNVLSYTTRSERMTRWNSLTKVRDAVAKHGLDSCDECLAHTGYPASFAHKRCSLLELKAIGQRISTMRRLWQLTQSEVAASLGFTQFMISSIELGDKSTKAVKLLKICDFLGLELIAVPRYLIPAIRKIEKKRWSK